MLHLVSHLLREHPDRADALRFPDERQPWRQRCADAEVNDDLDAAGHLPSVAGTLPSSLGLPDGQLAETYFAAQSPEQPADAGCEPKWTAAPVPTAVSGPGKQMATVG